MTMAIRVNGGHRIFQARRTKRLPETLREELIIRGARPADAPAVAALVDRLRLALGDPVGKLSAEAICRDGFGGEPEFAILVAERGGRLVGYALYLDAYEPSYAARGLYLADLFVVEAERRCGVGRQLVEAVAMAARARNRSFVWWVAQEGNVAALDFYRRLGPQFTSRVVAHALVVQTPPDD